jgi:hypothetical protein
MYFSTWRQSIPATVIVIFVHWRWPRQASRMTNPYRSAPIAPTTWLSPSRIAASIGILTAIFIVVTER